MVERLAHRVPDFFRCDRDERYYRSVGRKVVDLVFGMVSLYFLNRVVFGIRDLSPDTIMGGGPWISSPVAKVLPYSHSTHEAVIYALVLIFVTTIAAPWYFRRQWISYGMLTWIGLQVAWRVVLTMAFAGPQFL